MFSPKLQWLRYLIKRLGLFFLTATNWPQNWNDNGGTIPCATTNLRNRRSEQNVFAHVALPTPF